MSKLGEASTFQALIDLIKSKLGTAAYKDTPSSGNAGNSEVVLGSDSRLSDSRTPTSHSHTVSDISNFPLSMPASDVYSWAKESTKPSYNYSEIDNTPTLGSAAGKDIPVSGNAGNNEVVMGSDSRLTDSRTPTSHSHTVSDISDFPSLPTFGSAATRNVPASGDAANGEVVLGADSRLSDSRTPTSHSHTVSDISDFPSTMPPTSHTHTASDISDAGVASGLATLDANGKVPSSQLPAISASVETKEFNGSSYNSFGDLLYAIYTWGGDKIINASLYVTSQYWLYSVDFAFKKVSNKLRMTMNARYGNGDRVVFGHHWRCTKTDNTSGYSNEIYSSTSTTYPADESGTVTGYSSSLSASSLQYYILTVTKIA